MTDVSIQKLRDRLAEKVKKAQEEIADFSVTVLVQPTTTMSWSQSIFTAAAVIETNSAFVAYLDRVLEQNIAAEDAVAVLTKECNERTIAFLTRSQSSLPTTNLMDRATAANYAAILEWMRVPCMNGIHIGSPS